MNKMLIHLSPKSAAKSLLADLFPRSFHFLNVFLEKLQEGIPARHEGQKIAAG